MPTFTMVGKVTVQNLSQKKQDDIDMLNIPLFMGLYTQRRGRYLSKCPESIKLYMYTYIYIHILFVHMYENAIKKYQLVFPDV